MKKAPKKTKPKSIDDYLAGFVNAAEHTFEVSKRAVLEVKDDVVEGFSTGKDHLKGLVDKMAEEVDLKGLRKTALQYAKDGLDETREKLREQAENYQTYLDERVETHPEAVGLWDGFLNAFIQTHCTRKPKSRIYKRHVAYGRLLGWSASVPALLSHGVIRAIGALPYALRGGKYLYEKFADANEEVRKEESAEKPKSRYRSK